MSAAKGGALAADIKAATALAPSDVLAQAAEFGLIAVPAAEGSHYQVLRVVGNKVPTTAQRVVMAKQARQLAQAAGGRYVVTRTVSQPTAPSQPQPEEQQAMTKKGAGLPAGVSAAEIEKAHAANVKEVAAHEAEKAKQEKTKAKQEAKDRAEAAKASKTDVTPDPAKHLSPEARERAASATEGAVKAARKGKAAAKPTSAAAPKAAAKGGRPAKATDPDQKYRVVKDNTRSGHMKVFMLKAAELKTFTRKQLVDGTKSKVTAERAERYFDYCLYKKLIGEAK